MHAGPLSADLKIGTSCRNSLECLLFVPHSHCDWDKRLCTCQPYYVLFNETMCLPGTSTCRQFRHLSKRSFPWIFQHHCLVTPVQWTSSAPWRCPIQNASTVCVSAKPTSLHSVATNVFLVSISIHCLHYISAQIARPLKIKWTSAGCPLMMRPLLVPQSGKLLIWSGSCIMTNNLV